MTARRRRASDDPTARLRSFIVAAYGPKGPSVRVPIRVRARTVAEARKLARAKYPRIALTIFGVREA